MSQAKDRGQKMVCVSQETHDALRRENKRSGRYLTKILELAVRSYLRLPVAQRDASA